MKLRKLISMGIAAIMAVSAMSVSVFANDSTEPERDNAIIITENNEVKQITPITADAENVSTVISNNEVKVLNEYGEVIDIIAIDFEVTNEYSVRAVAGQKYTVKYNNEPLLAGGFSGADVTLTLEKGVSFWCTSAANSVYAYGYVKTGSSSYTYGYVRHVALS